MAGEDKAPAGTSEGPSLLNKKLWERLDNAVYEHFDYLKGLHKPDIEDLSVFAATVEIHFYLQNTLALQDENVVDRLLKFDNPLAVVLDAWERNGGAEDFDINRLLDEINAEATHPLWKDPDAALARLPELMERIDAEYDRLNAEWATKDAVYFLKNAGEIAATTECYEQFERYADYGVGVVEHLLNFQNPLEVLVSHWPQGISEYSEVESVMDVLLEDAKYDMDNFALVAGEADAQPEQQAPASLREWLKNAQQEISQQPPAEGGPDNGPEL